MDLDIKILVQKRTIKDECSCEETFYKKDSY